MLLRGELHLTVGLHDVDGIVADLFAVADDVHVVHARLVVVLLLVDVDDVVLFQLGAVVVDFHFNVERNLRIDGVVGIVQYGFHLGDGLVAQFKHVGNVFELFMGELLFGLEFSVDDAAHVVAAVGNTL